MIIIQTINLFVGWGEGVAFTVLIIRKCQSLQNVEKW